MYSKEDCFNFALGHLLLSRQVQNADTDPSNEAKVLRQNWESALSSSLADMDLDGTSTIVALELVAIDPNDLWGYAYKYPVNCTRFRRILSGVRTDNRDTLIDKQVGIHNGLKVIFTSESDALASIIPNNVPLNSLSSQAINCISARLAFLSSPLIVGKGAKGLRENIYGMYKLFRAEAQQADSEENFMYREDRVESEFVNERMS